MAGLQGHTLWYKISVEFFDHPKIFTIPINPRELYQRAICYSKKHLTDGYLTRETLRHIAKPQAADVCECIRKGRTILEICDEWIDILHRTKLLDVVNENFFQVHDYLKWNSSKEHVEEVQKKRRIAGRSGGKVKHLNKLAASKMLAQCLAKTYPETETETKTETKNKEKSSALQVRKPSAPTVVDEDWLKTVKETYSWIDVQREFVKCQTWCEVNRKSLSRRRLINWLNRIEKPLTPVPVKNYDGSYHKKVVL